MANQWYKKGLEGFAGGGVAWGTDTIKAQLIDTANYTLNINTDDFLNDVPAGARVGSAITLASKTLTDGILDAADGVFATVTGATVEALIIYKDTGVESTSRLLVYVDTATGLPATPNGGNINVAWDNGANKIAAL